MLWSSITICALCGGPAADPNLPGPYRVGVFTFVVNDEDRDGRAIRTEVWYPAEPTGAPAAPAIPRRAPTPATGPFPLVVFSHGHGAGRNRYQFLTTHLASHGYVVAAPDHAHDTLEELDVQRFLDPRMLVQTVLDRPMDVRVVADVLMHAADRDGHLLFGRLNGRLAVVGHSLGGSTALAVGGAWILDPTGPVADAVSNRHYRDFADPRVQAVVALAPVYQSPFAGGGRLPQFEPRGVEELQAPALIVGGSEDRVTPYQTHQLPLFRHSRGRCYLARLEGAAHLTFNDAEFLRLLPYAVRMFDRPTVERARTDAAIRRLLVAFLDRYLAGTDHFAEYLQPQPGIELLVRNGRLAASDVGGRRSSQVRRHRCSAALSRR